MALKNAPNKILITPEDIDRICDEYINKNRVSKIFWALVGVVIPAWLSIIIFDFKQNNTVINVVYITVLILLTILTICLLVVAHKNNNTQSMSEKIKNKSETNYSALFIISKIDTNIDGKQTIKLLLQRKQSWDCDFLPYVEIDNNWTLEERNEKLYTELASKLNLRKQDLKLHYLDDEDSYSIKFSIPDHTEKIFKYAFYNVSINNNVSFDLFDKNKWIDIDDLTKDVKIMRINGDVVESVLRLKSKIINSFKKEQEKNNIKIIWNITNNCGFNCNICATKQGNTKEMSFAEKNQALTSILTIKDNIREFNFAGGDPLSSEESKKIINYACNIFDDSKISITTTGKSINNLNQMEKQLFLKNCVVSIDISSDEKNDIRKTSDYNRTNIRYAKKYRALFSKLRINIPILNSKISDEKLNSIIKNVNDISPDEISLIKLMPVGRQKYEDYPQDYSALEMVDIINNLVDDNINIKVHLHCALRCDKNANGKECTMLTRKLGIDAQGNVFACCWAGYLGCEPNDNPFYLGNVLQDDLKNIIQNNEALTLNETSQRQRCNIFEYKKNTIFTP